MEKKKVKTSKNRFDCLFLLIVAVEWVDTQHRIAVTILMSLDWTAFATLLPAMAYFFTDWRILTAAVTSPLFLGMICWWYGVGCEGGNKNFQLTYAQYSVFLVFTIGFAEAEVLLANLTVQTIQVAS